MFYENAPRIYVRNLEFSSLQINSPFYKDGKAEVENC